MNKICFVVGLYGEEVNGGAEKHCKMLAEKATSLYNVEVLTSTANDYTTFHSFYSEGLTSINGVTVRRFQSPDFNKSTFLSAYKTSRLSRKIRRFFYKTGILQYLANAFPKWTFQLHKELQVLQNHGLYSPALIDYVVETQHQYQAIFLLSYPNPNFYFINKKISHKCVLIPTAHNEGDFFRAYLTDIFTTVKHIAFNTEAERKLCANIFGKTMSYSSILAVGTELAEPADYTIMREKFDLPDRYVLYFGRIAKEKMGSLIDWFLLYKNQSNDSIKLVLTGGLFMDKVNHPDILYTGFVNEEEKTALIQHAQLVINPSDRESLSLLLLETMQLGKPSLVNGKSEVLKQHCIDSDFACEYYVSQHDFIEKMKLIIELPLQDKEHLAVRAYKYIDTHYNWNLVLQRLNEITASKLG